MRFFDWLKQFYQKSGAKVTFVILCKFNLFRDQAGHVDWAKQKEMNSCEFIMQLRMNSCEKIQILYTRKNSFQIWKQISLKTSVRHLSPDDFRIIITENHSKKKSQNFPMELLTFSTQSSIRSIWLNLLRNFYTIILIHKTILRTYSKSICIVLIIDSIIGKEAFKIANSSCVGISWNSFYLPL